jgi:2-oxoglutarate/2-oxoacid ferredoxin oxidoreductase subunit alpha
MAAAALAQARTESLSAWRAVGPTSRFAFPAIVGIFVLPRRLLRLAAPASPNRGFMKVSQRGDLSIALVGEAGQGIQSIEALLVALSSRSGYHVFATKEYMSRVRGGVNSTSLRISSRPVSAPLRRIDLLIPLTPAAIDHVRGRIGPGTAIVADAEALGIGDKDGGRAKDKAGAPRRSSVIDVPFSKVAADLGAPIVAGVVAAGAVAAALGLDQESAVAFIRGIYERKGHESQDRNEKALRSGYAYGAPLAQRFMVERPKKTEGSITLSGADAVALGALAGGCDYVCGYPMSPGTSVLERMAKYSLAHDVVVEQVEDEVGVINMALGAWYAGARAFVSTSGGGFALMCEGLSLAGMIESPAVIHLAQRPGPATGLPTRTEQGDLNLALYAGHGDFPRVILAPGSLEEGYELTRRAFDLADEFQVPAFVLTDQYYVDSYYDTPEFKAPESSPTKHIVKTEADYKRFAYAKDGISPRGVPGNGKGIVCADSDEHSEAGYIIEDAETRVRMTDKRLGKERALRRVAIKPRLYGKAEAKTLLVSWGSTLGAAREALDLLDEESVALLHFTWLHPLPDLSARFKNAARVIAIENNAAGHFADLLEKEAGIKADARILRYDGRPFEAETLADEIRKTLSSIAAAAKAARAAKRATVGKKAK